MSGIVFSPLLPWSWLAALTAFVLLLGVYSLARRARGALLRMAALAIGLLALANPTLVREQREPLRDTALLVSDESPSQSIGDRTAATQKAVEALKAKLNGLPNLDVRVIHAGKEPFDQEGGTRLFAAMDRALSDVPADRFAGAILVTDGEVHDIPSAPELHARFPAPIHALLTGSPIEGDRRLLVERAPRFGIVGEPFPLALRINDFGSGQAEASALVSVTVDGKDRTEFFAPIGQMREVPITLKHAGANIVEIQVAEGPRELTLENNRATLIVSGVRDRLRVLLVSGEPNPGERTWRNLLRADPSVDLVHFTILRPPEKQDGTPVDELSLIAFPTRELFAEKLDRFDLIIFDRYRKRGVLPYAYYSNIAHYIQGGGALLIVAGAEFATPLSLYQTPLAMVLPAPPTGGVETGGFKPMLTELGRKHPVTADLPGGEGPDPQWGRWFRLIDSDPMSGQALMSGPGNRPLLVLDRVGQGRVAEILSDNAWLWARGFEGGGPQAELLRRLGHWLMKEPDLEEEQLSAHAEGERLVIARRTLGDSVEPVEVHTPSSRTEQITLSQTAPGRWQGSAPAPEHGLYRLKQGDQTAIAAVGVLDTIEFRDVRATQDLLAPVAAATGGSVRWLSQGGVPDVRMVEPGRQSSGRNWLGLRANGRYAVRGVDQHALMPALLVLILVLGGLMLAWRREGR